MDVNLVKEGTEVGASNAMDSIKEAVQWLGRTISEGFSALAEIIAKCWDSVSAFVCESAITIADFTNETVFPFLKEAGICTLSFLRSPAGPAFVGIGAGIGCAVVGDLCDSTTVKNGQVVREQPYLATAFRVGSLLSFLGAGIFVGYGIVEGFDGPLF